MERTPEERTTKEVFKNISEGKGSIGKPRRRWLDNVANDLNKTGVGGCRKMVRDRDAWKFILKEARVLYGIWSQGRREEVQTEKLITSEEF